MQSTVDSTLRVLGLACRGKPQHAERAVYGVGPKEVIECHPQNVPSACALARPCIQH